MKTVIFIAIWLPTVCVLVTGQDRRSVPSSDIDQSINAVDLSVHGEADGQAHETNPSGITVEVPMSLAKASATSAVWQHAAIGVPDVRSRSDNPTSSCPSFRPTAKVPMAVLWPGLVSASLNASPLGGHPETPDLLPKLLGGLPAHLTHDSSTSSSGTNGLFPMSSPRVEGRGLTGPFERNEPEDASPVSFPEAPFARNKGQSDTRKRKRPEQKKIANGAGVIATPKSLAPAKH